MDIKKCIKCGEEKPVDEFYRHPKMADGRLSKCKTCTKRDVRENRAAKPDHYKAYDAARGMRPNRVSARAAYQKSEHGKSVVRRCKEAWEERNPIKKSAQTAVGNAIRDGRMTRLPCEVCGEPKSHGHHDDYGKPLSVRWLCTKHHAEWHRHNDPVVPAL